MNVRLRRVAVDEKEILQNLLEKYMHEFSQWNAQDVNGWGMYGYNYLDNYWSEEGRYAFFIMAEDKLAGFAMVRVGMEDEEEIDYVMSEFFVMHKYRKRGVGKAAVYETLRRFHGKWKLQRHPCNLPAVHFWDKVIEEYTGGRYRLEEADLKCQGAAESLRDVFSLKIREGREARLYSI